MSNLIKNLKVLKDSNSIVEDNVSLESLLLEDSKNQIADAQNKDLSEQPAPAPTESRKSRRKKIRSNRVVSKKMSSGQTAKDQQQRKQNLFQDRNRKALLARQKQSHQKDMSGSRNKSLQRGNKIAIKRGSSEKIASALRPVVLACLDFQPVYDESRNLTSAGKLLTVKRAVRRLNIDKQIKIDLISTLLPIPLAVALRKFSDSKKIFLDSLDPSSLSAYEEALGAFDLTFEEDVSNTEAIYTFVKEYSHAVEFCTSRLDESASRSVSGDAQLVEKKGKTYENLHKSLKSASVGVLQFFLALPGDKEVGLKCLLAMLAKEVMASYNMQKGESSVLKRDPERMFATRYRGKVLSDPQSFTAMSSAQGILFTDTISVNKKRKKVVCYPLEVTDVLNNKYTTKSARGFIEDLMEDTGDRYTSYLTNRRYTTPYDAIADSYDELSDTVSTLLDNSSLNFGDSMYVGFMNTILSDVLTNLTNSKNSTSDAVQTHILRLASDDKEMLGMLLVYLAFRSERVSSPGESSVAVKLLKDNSKLKSYVGKMDTGTVKKKFSVNPQNIELDPGIDGETSFSAPDKAQTATLDAEPSDLEEGTLESKFGVSFEEICDGFASHLNNHISSTASVSDSVSAARSVAVGLSSVYDVLTDVVSEDSLFDYLLRFETALQSALPTADTEVTSIFDASNRTQFSSLRKKNIFMAYSKIVCDTVSFLLDGRSSIKTSGKVSISPSKRKSGSSKLASGIQKMSIKGLSVKGLSGKSSGSSSKDPTITINFSSDFTSSLQDVQAYLNNDEIDFDDISPVYPVVSLVGASLLEEENFLKSFHESLSDYYSSINSSFDDVDTSLDRVVNGISLRDMIKQGLVPSRDIARLLSYFYWFLNEQSMMVYSGTKTFDHTIGPSSFKYLKKRLESSDFLKKKKVFAIGIPAGLLEQTETTPAEIGEIRSGVNDSQKDKFSITVQKIDQVRPDVEYKDLTFQFPREWFAIRPENDYDTLYVNPMADDPNVDSGAEWVKGDAEFSSKFSSEIMLNTRNDFVLKLWSDLQLDIDLFETAFFKNKESVEQVENATVDLSVLDAADTVGSEFLSGSNLAFDSQNRKLNNFDFFNSDTNTLSLAKNETGDPYAMSAFDYANTYGSLFNVASMSKRYSDSVEFERVVCILIDDDDFEVDEEILEEGDRDINAQMNKQMNYEKEVSLGRPTSYGIDLNTYRFTVTMGEE